MASPLSGMGLMASEQASEMHVAEVDHQSQEQHRARFGAEPEDVGCDQDVGLSPQLCHVKAGLRTGVSIIQDS